MDSCSSSVSWQSLSDCLSSSVASITAGDLLTIVAVPVGVSLVLGLYLLLVYARRGGY